MAGNNNNISVRQNQDALQPDFSTVTNQLQAAELDRKSLTALMKIGRASCRERV